MGAIIDSSLRQPFLLTHRGPGGTQRFQFPIAPQRVKVSRVARGAIHQTLDDNWLDQFSGPRSVLAAVELRGTFGYALGRGSSGGQFGSQYLTKFERTFEAYNAQTRQALRDADARQEYQGLFRLHYWRIWVDHFDYDIASNDPLLFYYDLHFYRLEDYLAGGGGAGSSRETGLSPTTAASLRELTG